MATTHLVAGSRPTRHNVFERTESCHPLTDIGAALNRRLRNKGLAKYARARRHYPPLGREVVVDGPSQGSAERFDDAGTASDQPSRRREAANAIGEVLLLAAALGMILTTAVAVAAGLAYLLI